MKTHRSRSRILIGAGGLLCASATAVQAQRPTKPIPVPNVSHAVDIDSTDETPMTALVPLTKRWAELFRDVLIEFKRDGRDPTAILQGAFPTREIRILLSPNDEDGGVRLVLTEQELLTADLRAAASALYQTWKAAGKSGTGAGAS